MPNPTAYTFWLDQRQVTGVIVAENDEEKLVEYGKRRYVVIGKNPGKKHYTASTTPALWKKIINSEAHPSPSSSAAKQPAKARPKKANAEKPSTKGEGAPSPATHLMGIPRSEIDEAIENRDAVRKAAKGKIAQGTHEAATKKRAPKAVKKPTTRALPVPAGLPAATKATKTTRTTKAAPSPTTDPNSSIWLKCPYCFELELISALEREPGKAYIKCCKSCKREFGVRIAPMTTYHVEVAAFQ
jgi:hypothetical protein